jgi:hypothetical protein
MDFVAISAAVTDAIATCEAHGHMTTAETLRVHAGELLRLARQGLAREPNTDSARHFNTSDLIHSQIHG